MNCIVIEDEPAAQAILQYYISRYPGLDCPGIFRDAFSAQAFLNTQRTDLIFLDINLPEMSGIGFLRSQINPPLVIFTTAYPQYAIDGFDLEIVDFLLKPFSFERFCKAVNKARERFVSGNNHTSPEKITVRSDRRTYIIPVDDILYIETCGDYVSVHLTDKKLIVHGTLKSWEEKMKGYSFQKVHRTVLVNLHKIEHTEGNLISIGSHKVPVSEPYKAQLMEKLFSK